MQFGLHSANCMRPDRSHLRASPTHAIRPSFGESHQAGSVASSSIASSCASVVMAKSISSGQGGDASSASGDAIRQVARPAARPQRMSSIESPTKRHLMRRPIRGHHSSSRGNHLSWEAPDERGQSEVITGAINQGSSSGRLTHRAAIRGHHRRNQPRFVIGPPHSSGRSPQTPQAARAIAGSGLSGYGS